MRGTVCESLPSKADMECRVSSPTLTVQCRRGISAAVSHSHHVHDGRVGPTRRRGCRDAVPTALQLREWHRVDELG
jgi:hypothetical protein